MDPEDTPPPNPNVHGPHQEQANRGCKRTERGSSSQAPKPRKKYPKRAAVWQHFIQREEDTSKCNCRYCGLELGCDSKTSGTSPMIGHIARCQNFLAYEAKEKQKNLVSGNDGNMKMVKFDPFLFRRSVNELVVVNELAFSFVESEGWRRFCSNVLPQYSPFSRKTCTSDIVAMYLAEKEELKKLFKAEKQRVSLTTDIWTAPTTSYNYMVITAHWIDKNWKMQKRILSFKVVTDHKAETIQGQLIDCLEEWDIVKVFTVTVDNAKANDKAVRLFAEYLKRLGGDTLVLDGEWLHMRCCSHILNLIVGDGLQTSKPSVAAVRNATKYVRSSFTRLKSFEMRCEVAKVCRGSLPLDIKTRWNSTYLMLTAAKKLRVAFEKMMVEDKLYCEWFKEDDEKTRSKRDGPPASSDWDQVHRLIRFLKVFYKSTLVFSASNTVTSTLCYTEIVNIEKCLINRCSNSDPEIKNQAHMMRDKFEKYWDGLLNMNPLVIVGSVFDPHQKMLFPLMCFEELYGKNSVEARKLNRIVLEILRKLYDEYSERLKTPLEVTPVAEEAIPVFEPSDDEDDDFMRVDTLYSKMVNQRTHEVGCSELEIYLAEKAEIRVVNALGLKFDILGWWKSNSSKFPILSELARDVLAMQMSSVASESAFSTSGRVLDPYRSSLTPYMIEVLLCLQQWLKCGYKAQSEVLNLSQLLEEYEFYDSLDSKFSLPTSQI